MQVFMDLAIQMCEESEKICATGQVKFLHFVDYFSQKSPGASVVVASGMNSLTLGQTPHLGDNIES